MGKKSKNRNRKSKLRSRKIRRRIKKQKPRIGQTAVPREPVTELTTISKSEPFPVSVLQKGPEFVAESLFKARIKVVGIGGGGGSIVSEIEKSLGKATFVIADTDIRALKKKSGIKYLWFGQNLTRGLGTGVNVDLAKEAAEAIRGKIGDIFKDQDIIIFISSLGGGIGSGATQIFLEEAKKFNAITLGIFTLPFKFEGRNKARIAQNALRSLRPLLNVSLTIPNEKIFKIIDESTPITNAFSMVNKSLINSLESLISLIYNPGIINIDFADLRTILSGEGNSAFLNTIEESGKNRADKICEKIFFNPLLQKNSLRPEKILFNIMGAENLSMFEVEKISSHIAKHNPDAKIIFGISKSLKLRNRIKTTILTTGTPGKGGTAPRKTESSAGIVKRKKFGRKKRIIKPKIKRRRSFQKAPELPSFFPSFESSAETSGAVADSVKEVKMSTAGQASKQRKNAIRRSGLEIKKAEEQEEKKRIAQEKEWEIPAFLRRVKFNK